MFKFYTSSHEWQLGAALSDNRTGCRGGGVGGVLALQALSSSNGRGYHQCKRDTTEWDFLIRTTAKPRADDTGDGYRPLQSAKRTSLIP